LIWQISGDGLRLFQLRARGLTRRGGTVSCYNGHATNTAVENTFVQFYPTLFEVAKKMGTVNATYHPMKKVSRPPAMVRSRRGRL